MPARFPHIPQMPTHSSLFSMAYILLPRPASSPASAAQSAFHHLLSIPSSACSQFSRLLLGLEIFSSLLTTPSPGHSPKHQPVFSFFLNNDVTMIATPAYKSSVGLHFRCTKGLHSMDKSLSILALAYQPPLSGTKSSSGFTHNSLQRPYTLSELIHPQNSRQGAEG